MPFLYRYLAVIIFNIIFFMLGKYILLQPIADEITAMEATKINLQNNTLNEAPLFVNKTVLRAITQEQLLNWQREITQRMDHSIQKRNLIPEQIIFGWRQWENEKVLEIKLQMVGEYKNFLQWFSELGSWHVLMWVANNKLRVQDSRHVKIYLQIYILPYLLRYPVSMPGFSLATESPFCLMPFANVKQSILQASSFRDWHLIGVLLGDEPRALLQYANQNWIEVNVGTKIGKEQAVVSDIKHNYLDLQISYSERYRLWLRK